MNWTERVLTLACEPVQRRDNVIYSGVTGREISKVSKKYCLVQNRDVIMPFVNKFGIDSVKRLTTFGRDKYTYVEFNTGRQFNFRYNDKDDIVDERIIVQNSFIKKSPKWEL